MNLRELRKEQNLTLRDLAEGNKQLNLPPIGLCISTLSKIERAVFLGEDYRITDHVYFTIVNYCKTYFNIDVELSIDNMRPTKLKLLKTIDEKDKEITMLRKELDFLKKENERFKRKYNKLRELFNDK